MSEAKTKECLTRWGFEIEIQKKKTHGTDGWLAKKTMSGTTVFIRNTDPRQKKEADLFAYVCRIFAELQRRRGRNELRKDIKELLGL
jgi:hypothetical protein